jgi:hypothetical protein
VRLDKSETCISYSTCRSIAHRSVRILLFINHRIDKRMGSQTELYFPKLLYMRAIVLESCDLKHMVECKE